MSKLNKIEEKLKDSASEELELIVDGFVKSLDTLEDKYGPFGTYYDFEIKDALRLTSNTSTRDNGEIYRGVTNGFSISGKHKLKKLLWDMMEDRYSERMVSKKSEELIEKLEFLK